ncbi:MAG: ABC transporter permease [Halobacteriota archaeon]
MKSIDVTLKGIRETFRDRRGLALLIGFPVILIVLFAFAFGSGSFVSGGSIPHQIVVINNDSGITPTINNTTKYVNYGANFTGVLENATAENSTKKLFQLNNVSQDKAEDMLKSRNIDALIIIPENFSSALTTMVNNSTRTAIASSVGQQAIANSTTRVSTNAVSNAGLSPVAVTLPGANVTLPQAGNVTSTLFVQGDTSNINFASAQSLISGIFDHYKNNLVTNATVRAAPGASSSLYTNYVPVETLPLAGTQSFSRFDFLMPGLIVFAVLLQVSLIASSLVRDDEMGLLNRLKLSKLRAFDLLFGTFLTWTIITVGQTLILIGIAIALGFHYQGDFSSLGLATLIGAIAGMASISLALLIASFSEKNMQALILGAMIATPLAFLAGAFLPLPRQVFVEFGGRPFQVYDVLPWTHAVSSLRSVLTFGSGLSGDVVYEMTWLIVLTAILFVVGVVTYAHVKLKAEK